MNYSITVRRKIRELLQIRPWVGIGEFLKGLFKDGGILGNRNLSSFVFVKGGIHEYE